MTGNRSFWYAVEASTNRSKFHFPERIHSLPWLHWKIAHLPRFAASCYHKSIASFRSLSLSLSLFHFHFTIFLSSFSFSSSSSCSFIRFYAANYYFDPVSYRELSTLLSIISRCNAHAIGKLMKKWFSSSFFNFK